MQVFKYPIFKIYPRIYIITITTVDSIYKGLQIYIWYYNIIIKLPLTKINRKEVN